MLFERTDSVNVNPPYPATSHLTDNGSSWLWAVFAIYAFVDLAFILWSFFLPRGTRLFHHLAIMILTVGTIAYFAQASDLGFTTTPTEFGHHSPVGTLRQIWWTRYVSWILTGPLLLLCLTFITGLNLSDTATLLVMFDVLWVNLLIGGLVRSTYKWGFYVFGVVGLFYTWFALFTAIRSASRLGKDYATVYTSSVAYLSLLFLLYPIAWGCADGGNVISVTSEFIWYGILDVLAQPFFLIYFLFAIRSLDLERLHFASGKYTDYTAEHGHTHSTHTHGTAGDIEKAPRTSRSFKGNMFSKKGRHDVVEPVSPGAAVVEPVGGGTTHAHTGREGQPRVSEQTFVAEERLV